MPRISRIKAAGCAIAILATALPAAADIIEKNCAIPLSAAGQVMTLSGSAVATDGAGCARDLACGSPIYGGEAISTGAGSSAGFLMGDVLTQLGPESSASIGTTPAGAPDIALKQGSVHVVDTREEGPPVALSALDSSTEFTGADAGATISGGAAAFCSDTPLAISSGGSLTNVTPAACGDFAAGGGGAGGGLGGLGSLGALAADTCMQVASNDHIPPTPPVSTPPNGPPVPDPPDSPPRNPCEVGACVPPPPRVTVQPPTTTPFPGGTGGTFGGGGGN